MLDAPPALFSTNKGENTPGEEQSSGETMQCGGRKRQFETKVNSPPGSGGFKRCKVENTSVADRGAKYPTLDSRGQHATNETTVLLFCRLLGRNIRFCDYSLILLSHLHNILPEKVTRTCTAGRFIWCQPLLAAVGARSVWCGSWRRHRSC